MTLPTDLYRVLFFGVPTHCQEVVQASSAYEAECKIAARYGKAFCIKARIERTDKEQGVTQMTYNRTPYTQEQIASFTLLGRTVSNWRKRDIALYQHPGQTDRVISVGVTFDGDTTIIADESKSDWATALEHNSRRGVCQPVANADGNSALTRSNPDAK